MSSMGARLLLLLLGGSVAVWAIAGALSFSETRRALDEILDAELAAAARLLLAQAAHELREGAEPFEEEDDEDELEDDAELSAVTHGDLEFQLLGPGGALLYRSSRAVPAAPLSRQSEGFSNEQVGGVAWRVYSRWDARHQVQVKVGRPVARRQDAALGVAHRLMAPMFVGLPLLAALIFWAVRSSLAPLGRLTEEVAKRDPEHLAPLITPAPRELEPMVARLNHLLAALGAALARERRFTADAAHELRTPLAGLKTQAEVALHARDQAELEHSLQQLSAGVDRTAHLAQQLLTLARLDPEAGLEEPARFDLRAVVLDTLRELGQALVDKRVEVDVEGLAPAELDGHPLLLGLLVRNLVDNAVKYGPSGGHLTLRTERGGDEVKLVVLDEGPGIAAAERERVFDRFYRLPGTQAPGSGLGLSIVRRIVELHHGRIELAANPVGRGLQVTAVLPIARDE